MGKLFIAFSFVMVMLKVFPSFIDEKEPKNKGKERPKINLDSELYWNKEFEKDEYGKWKKVVKNTGEGNHENN